MANEENLKPLKKVNQEIQLADLLEARAEAQLLADG